LTIQAGIDAAGPGDEVVICEGTYTGPGNRDLDFGGKAITVRGQSGAAATIIDCEGSSTDPHRGFRFHRAEGEASVLEDVSIINAYAPTELVGWDIRSNGGGIYVGANCRPTIRRCVIRDSHASSFGGGIFCAERSEPTLVDCTIHNNESSGHDIDGGGGGIYCHDESKPTIKGCMISENSATQSYGGGIYCGWYAKANIEGCVIQGNVATESGGGVDTFFGQPRVVNCCIHGNHAVRGAGINVGSFSWPTITNCIIAYNFATESGGGVNSYGLWDMANSIVWGNIAPDGPQIAVRSTEARVSYSNVRGGMWGVFVADTATLVWGDGNTDANPMFADPDGPDNNGLTWADNDYHPTADSPGIDAGNNTVNTHSADYSPVPLPETDLEGLPRFMDDPSVADTGYGEPPIVDMGPYEYEPVQTDPQLVAAYSRRLHGGDGEYDLELSLTGPPVIEARQNGSVPQMVLVYDQPPVNLGCEGLTIVGGACVDMAVSGNALVVDMIFDANACVEVTASNDTVRVLAHEGNVNGNDTVDVVDLQDVKNSLFQPVDLVTCVYDVNCDGQINVIDLQETKNNVFSAALCD
jgi:hypothetical protein